MDAKKVLGAGGGQNSLNTWLWSVSETLRMASPGAGEVAGPPLGFAEDGWLEMYLRDD